MSSIGDEHAAIGFIKTLFGPSTSEPVYLCSLPNDKGDAAQAPERSIADRDAETLSAFLNRWDRHGRGCYFSVSTMKAGGRRNKANAQEMPAIAADIDFKSIMEDHHKVDQVLGQVRCLPSVVVHSGHGRHPYWILKEAVRVEGNLERIEAIQKQLADVFGGDLEPTHVAALMRLPGTHNTKGGQWLDVTMTEDTGVRYEIDDLEAWLAEQSPLLRRKQRPKPPDENPYLAAAKILGFKPPIDVEERLGAMTYQGAGDASIHSTQVAVSSSLISRGTEIEQVVDMILGATRTAAGDYGARWNWGREEANIRRMCVAWLAKIEKPKHAAGQPSRKGGNQPPPRQTESNPRESEVVDIAQARATRVRTAPAPVATAPPGSAKKFHAVAEATVMMIRSRGEDLLFENGTCWHYCDSLWSIQADARSWLNRQIEQAARAGKLRSDTKMVNEARGYLERNPELWPVVAWDQHGLVPTRSGLIDPRSLVLHAATPDHRVTWRVACAYDPEALCPRWLAMLREMFTDRPPEMQDALISSLQEVLGSALIDRKPRGLRKALVLVGGPNSGKSQLLAVFRALFGDAVIGQLIGMVDGPHGLMPFQRRLPWILDEAFNQNVWHLSATVKTLITGEAISINIKNGPILTHRFVGPIFWATNHPPQFKESTKAIVDRLVIVECRQQFDGSVVAPSDAVIEHELPGVLTWALEGLRRALERGAIDAGIEGREASARVYRDSNLVAGFIEDCVDYDDNGMISMPDFCVAVSAWYAESKGEDRRLPSNDSIGKALVALNDPRIATDRNELRDKTTRYVVGISLNSHGLEYHERGVTAAMFEGKTVQTTSAGGQVNRSIPISWDVKSKVKAMRFHHLRIEKTSVIKETRDDTTKGHQSGDVSSDVSSGQPSDPSKKPRF